jgi:hypothetical protein
MNLGGRGERGGRKEKKLQTRHYLSVKIAKFSKQFFILRQQVKL